MCGRFSLGVGGDEVSRAYRAIGADILAWRPRYSIAPSSLVPVITADRQTSPDDPDDGHRLVEAARWGFHPSWARDRGPRPINARLETVADKGMFRSAFARHRAVVPMTGYFEWTTEGGSKQPHHIGPPVAEGAAHPPLLNAAAILAPRPHGDQWSLTMAVITTTARDGAGTVHDRMPAFLPDDELDEWLDPHPLDTTGAHGLASHLARACTRVAATLTTHRVDPRLNDVRRVDPGDPGLVAPVDRPRTPPPNAGA